MNYITIVLPFAVGVLMHFVVIPAFSYKYCSSLRIYIPLSKIIVHSPTKTAPFHRNLTSERESNTTKHQFSPNGMPEEALA
jgi:hypothetical protein